jgi:NADH:ubiquinone oxidoreductase subunit H
MFVGYFGLLQPFARWFKVIIVKRRLYPIVSNKLLFFFLLQFFLFFLSLALWVVIPY